MDARSITDDFVSKYLQLLENVLDDSVALTSMKVNFLYCQYNKNDNENSQQNKNESTIENHCQHCLIPWKDGRFTMKTYRKHQNKNSKLQKERSKFTMVMKCLVCSRLTKSIFDKNKVHSQKSIKKPSHKPIENIIATPKVEEEEVDIFKKKPKKKKRNLYAGLNPLVFKNRDLCKKK